MAKLVYDAGATRLPDFNTVPLKNSPIHHRWQYRGVLKAAANYR